MYENIETMLEQDDWNEVAPQSGGRRLAQPQDTFMQALQHHGCRILRRGPGQGPP